MNTQEPIEKALASPQGDATMPSPAMQLANAALEACPTDVREHLEAVRDGGELTFAQGLRLATAERPLANSLVATGFSYLPDRRSDQARVLTRVLPAIRDIRRFGSAALDLCWVGGGRVDAFYEWGLQVWDRAAGVLIATEAGAHVADLPGGTVIAAAPGLLAPLRALLEEAGAA